MRFGSDLVVDLLASLGIEYAACNPGATFRGLHDSLVQDPDRRVGLIECLHEEDSVAIAHGYAKASARPMAAVVHDIVGLQHASMAIYNAWCDRVPLVVLGATGPVDAARRRPWIDWIHTANTQATQVRDYTKWDDQPASIEALPESLVRAHHLAVAAPPGPVYVCLDTGLQEAPLPDPAPELPTGVAAPTPLSPHPPAVDRLADLLLAAEAPVVLADRVGRSTAAVRRLVELADLLALPVIDRELGYNKVSLNFPTHHPLNLSGDLAVTLGEADLVVGLDTQDLLGSLRAGEGPRPGAPVVLVSVDYLLAQGWSGDVQALAPADLHIAAEAGPLLDALLPRIRAALPGTPGAAEAIAARRRRLEARGAATRTRWRAEAAAASAPGPGRLPRATVASVLDEVTAGADRVVANGTLSHWALRLFDLGPGQYCGGAGGAGLGYGLGGSIGVALANRDTDRLVIDLQSDGDAMATPQALWVAAHERLPLLIVVDNDRSFTNSVNHAERVALARGRPVQAKTVGMLIDDPPVDFAALARSMGVHGEGPVTTVDELGPALERAVNIVTGARRPALVDVLT